MKKKVKGVPNVYEFDQSVVVACEGNGKVGHVFRFCKKDLQLMEEWEIDGFIWDVCMFDESVCVTAYMVDLDMARLYVLQGKSIDFVELGTHFAPADLLELQGNLYISAYPLTMNSPRKVLKLDKEFSVEKEYDVSICPRFLFEKDNNILIQELDVKTGRSDRYSLLNLRTGQEVISRRSMPIRTANF